jgi:hypothetical protein
MHSSEVTLADIFMNREAALSGEQRQDVETQQQTAALKEALEKETEAFSWPVIVDKIAEQIAAALSLPIKKILVSAWQKKRLFDQYRDRSESESDETILLPLAEHTIRSEHHPRIEVFFNGRLIHTITLDIALHLDLEGFMLTLRGGKLMDIQTGKCQAKGRVMYDKATLLKKDSEALSLPGTFHFGDDGLELNDQEEDHEGEPYEMTVDAESEDGEDSPVT